jgi:hypothetical protein
MTDWYSSVYKGFIIAGVIAFLIGFFSSGAVSLDSFIAGYSVLILGIMMVLTLLINNVLKMTQSSSLESLLSILMATGPFLLMLGVIAFILYLMIKYKELIIEEKVSKGYYTFSNISVILLLIQLYIVYININTPKFDETGKMSQFASSLIYLLGVLGTISSIILFTILKYFTTDGFTSM